MIQCNNCGSNNRKVKYPKCPDAAGKSFYDIIECPECGLIYTKTENIDTESIYDESYYKEIYPDYFKDKKVHLLNARTKLKKIEKYFGKGSICEIGCAFGFFLDCARDMGWDVTGFEISDFSREYAVNNLGLPVYKNFLEKAHSKLFDIICMFDTIEHLEDPSALIDRCCSLLRPGGGLVITTGDIGSPHAKLFGKKWRLITPPEHLFFYSKKTLGDLLKKHSFNVVYCGYQSKYFNFFSIIEYLVGIKSGKLPIIPLKINTLDVMTVIAEKH